MTAGRHVEIVECSRPRPEAHRGPMCAVRGVGRGTRINLDHEAKCGSVPRVSQSNRLDQIM